MYYLDLHSLHKQTSKEERKLQRSVIRRDYEMARKLKFQHNQCFYCGCDIDMSGHLDHVIPVMYGGRSSPSNTVATCRLCNYTKGTDHLEITNPYTIRSYLKLIEAHNKYLLKLRRLGVKSIRYQPKKERLYHTYHADLFRQI